MDHSSNCIQPLVLSLSSALIQTPAIINWNASSAHAATNPTMARPVTSLSCPSFSDSASIESVGACDSLEPEATALRGWVGACKFTVALGKAAVPAAVGNAGLVASGAGVAVPMGLVEVASLMVGAGAGLPAVPASAGLVITGAAGFGGIGGTGAFASLSGAGGALFGGFGTVGGVGANPVGMGA